MRLTGHHVDEAAVDAVLTASRTVIAVATQSLGAAAEETTIAQYRALVVLASRGPQRMTDLASALDVTPPAEAVAGVLQVFATAAGEIPDSQWPAVHAEAAGASATTVPQLAHAGNGRR
jgi:hypothetical protein